MRTFTRRGFIWIVLALSLCMAYARSAQAQIYVTAIDYQGNYYATDKTWFYKNLDGSLRSEGGGRYPDVERVAGRAFNINQIVYLRGSNIVIKWTFQNRYASAFSGKLTFKGARLKRLRYGSYVTLVPPADQSLYIPSGGIATVTTTFTGTPNYTTASDFEVDFAVLNSSGASVLSTNGWAWLGRVLLTLAAPVRKMAIPWTEPLTYASYWADGATDVTTASTRITFGLTDSGLMRYPDDTASRWYTTTGYFKLKTFLETKNALANCADVSAFLALCAWSIGVPADLAQLYPSNGGQFRTNWVCLIGKDRRYGSNYSKSVWGWHQITLINSAVYDSCGSQYYNLSGQAVGQPPANWNLYAYWQKATGSNPPFLGLVEGYATSSQPQGVPIGGKYVYINGVL